MRGRESAILWAHFCAFLPLLPEIPSRFWKEDLENRHRVSFAEYSLFYRALLQKRPIN